MRQTLFACVVAASSGLCLCAAAKASTKVSVKTTHYAIDGQTGEALVAQMDRYGPKHGYLTRAIAQTKYRMRSDAVWRYEKGYCRPADPVVRLDITYVYPRVASPMSAALRARWARFMRGVERHEQKHGRIARDMANAAASAIGKMRFADNSGCMKSRALLKHHLGKIVAAYERKQVAFDEAEHRDGGPVDSLLWALRK
ncbi:MAG: DUF922 domain-containing protein [Rhizobiaceae bacterium]|nr:DUF922 domain-containing protein [Rhizobiaceae bacterium]MCV0405431.1 DUF922 domain-containing protein [Rhizobiaceae bacterium]